MNEPQKLMFSQSILAQSSVRKEILGAPRTLHDGRSFNYCRNGAVDLAAGKPVESLDAVANNINLAVVADVAIGSTTVRVTNGGTAVTEDQYQWGYLQINAGAGLGRQYLIDTHTAETTGTGTITIQLAEPIGVALTSATSKASLIYNPFTGIVVATAATKTPAGVPPIAVTALYYFWSQTCGVGCALNTNAVAVGTELAGGAGLLAARTAHTDNSYGYTYATAGVTAEYKPIILTMK
jgi:hypothetical protein